MTQEAFSSYKATYPLPVIRTCFLGVEPGLEEERPGFAAELMGEGC